jgi:hypothetical protein
MKTFILTNFATGQTLRKTQSTMPKVKGFTVVSAEVALPEINRAGHRLFRDANNRPYYAATAADGSHRQP